MKERVGDGKLISITVSGINVSVDFLSVPVLLSVVIALRM